MKHRSAELLTDEIIQRSIQAARCREQRFESLGLNRYEYLEIPNKNNQRCQLPRGFPTRQENNPPAMFSLSAIWGLMRTLLSS